MEYLTHIKNGFFWVTQTMGVYDPVSGRFRKPGKWVVPGTADICGIYRGIPIVIELKSKTGRLSEDQKNFLLRVNSVGGIAGMARSINEVRDLLILADELAEMRDKLMEKSSKHIIRNQPQDS